ncbi:MAG TPA: energy transducer TonB [Pyrinomonadaceae bacterium]|jgi:TonB family protein
MKRPLLIIAFVVAALARVPAAPQGGAGHFGKDGLSFDYPPGWTLEDKSTAELQHLILRRPGSSVILMVVVQREPLQSAAQSAAVHDTITQPYVEHIARQLGARAPEAPDPQCIPLGGSLASGYRLSGRLDKEPSTGEVYVGMVNQRLVHLIYVRADRDEAEGAAGWKAVRDTLNVEPPANPSPDALKMARVVTGGVLNGKAIRKPRPDYPITAKRARAQGTVVVQLTVDEEGNVVSAMAVSGHTLLRGAAEDAARHAKFSPTLLCGKPVQVTGVVTYNFVLAY